jgi:hypothetical protein
MPPKGKRKAGRFYIGQFSISFHFAGYVTPDAQVISSVSDDSLLVDFSITPAEAAQANAA